MDKRPLVLWSGGVDSTAICDEFVKEGKRFDVLYVNGGQGALKTKAELNAIREIMEYWESTTYDRRPPTVVEAKSNVTFAYSPSGGFRQAIAWIVAALEVVDPTKHSEVIIGYIAGDQILTELHAVQQAWKYMWAVGKIGPVVPIIFPLKYVTKVNVIATLPPELYTLTWVCEIPRNPHGDTTILPCGECPGCVNREVEAFRYLKVFGKAIGPDKWTTLKQSMENLHVR